MIVFCMNGVFECLDNYCLVIYFNCVYINFLLEWCLDDKISVIIEMDYLNDNCIFYISLVNLLKDMEENLYDMLYNKFLGFKNDNVNNKMLIYVVCIICQLIDNISVWVVYFGFLYKVDNISIFVKIVVNKEYNMCRRMILCLLCDDCNLIFQFDFIGRDIFIGFVKYIF